MMVRLRSPNNSMAASGFLSLTFARVPLDEMDDVVQVILSRISPGRFQRETGVFFPSRIYEEEPPAGGAHLFRVAIYSPKISPSTSVVITNVADGWNSLSHLMAREHQEFQIQIISTKPDAVFPKNRFEVWKFGVSVRIVMAMRDSDKWVFFQKGIPESFEEINIYNNPLKRCRLTRECIVQYMLRSGLDLTVSTSFEAYGDAVYYEETRKS